MIHFASALKVDAEIELAKVDWMPEGCCLSAARAAYTLRMLALARCRSFSKCSHAYL